jgi:hypothetical protein
VARRRRSKTLISAVDDAREKSVHEPFNAAFNANVLHPSLGFNIRSLSLSTDDRRT